jgi:uncharacterized RDD family membrane protein YckC
MSGTGGSGQPVGPAYPGQRLGLPETGSGSVASWGRRIGALFIDWFASSFVAYVIVQATGTSLVQEWVTLLVFFVEVTLFTGLVGGSFGQLALRVWIARVDGRPVTILDAMIRTFLICLVIPPVVFNPDRRGIHDLVVKTVALQR